MATRTAPADVTRVIDGDTFVGTLKVWDNPKIWLPDTRFRIDALNCPELKDKDTGEPIPEGVAAREFVERWLVDENGDWLPISVASRGRDEYGRTLAVVTAKFRPSSLNSALLEAGHAVPVRMMAHTDEF